MVEKLWQWFIFKGLSAFVAEISFFPGWQNSSSLFLSGFTSCPKSLAYRQTAPGLTQTWHEATCLQCWCPKVGQIVSLETVNNVRNRRRSNSSSGDVGLHIYMFTTGVRRVLIFENRHIVMFSSVWSPIIVASLSGSLGQKLRLTAALHCSKLVCEKVGFCESIIIDTLKDLESSDGVGVIRKKLINIFG